MKTKQKKNKSFFDYTEKEQRQILKDAGQYQPFLDVKNRLSSLEERVNELVKKYPQIKQYEEIQPSSWCECKKPNHWDGHHTWDRGFCYWCHKPLNPIKPLQPMAKKEDDKELRDEIRTMLFVHPLWNGKHKDTNELADKIIALIKE